MKPEYLEAQAQRKRDLAPNRALAVILLIALSFAGLLDHVLTVTP